MLWYARSKSRPGWRCRSADAADKSANAQLGDVPCLFGTLASQRYNWDDVIRTIAKVEGIDDYKELTSLSLIHI